jgi:hypothetical protein
MNGTCSTGGRNEKYIIVVEKSARKKPLWRYTRLYPKVSVLATWSENYEWYSSATSCSCIAIL